MRYTVKLMNSMGMSLLPHRLCYEMNSLRRGILGRKPWWWHSVSTHMVVWIKALQAETANLYPEKKFYPSEEVSLPHTWRKRYNEINLPPGTRLTSPGNGAISWAHVGLFCRKIEHPEVAVSLVRGNSCSWVHAYRPSLPLWTLYSQYYWTRTGATGYTR